MVSELYNRAAVRLLRNYSQTAEPEKREPGFGRAPTQTGNPSLAYGAMEKGTMDMVYMMEEMCTWNVCKGVHAEGQRSSPPLFQPARCQALTGLSATSVWYSYYHVQQIKSITM